MPAAVIHNPFGESQRQYGQGNVEYSRAGIYQSTGERANLFRAGNVVENGGCRELAPQLCHATHEIVHNHQAGAENPGNNLAPGQGGTQYPERDEEHAGKPQYQVRSNPVCQTVINVTHGINAITQTGVHIAQITHPRVEHHWQPQNDVEQEDCKILTQNNLCGCNRCGEQPLQRAQTFLFRHGTHGDKREDKDKVKPEVHIVEHVVHYALPACLAHGLQYCLQPEPLQTHGAGQKYPSKGCS